MAKIYPGTRTLLEFPTKTRPLSPGKAQHIQAEGPAKWVSPGRQESVVPPPPPPPPVVIPRFVLCMNPFAVASSVTQVFIPQIVNPPQGLT